MRLVTARHHDRTVFGPLDADDVCDVSDRWGTVSDAIAAGAAAISEVATTAPRIPLGECELGLPSPRPARILCVGLNYHDHREESASKSQAGDHPTIFTRYVSSLVAHGQPIVRPRASDRFDYEGELAVVIGRSARHVPASAATEYVFGYSCFQDGSLRDFQRHSGQFTPGKNFDRSGSFGPWIVTPDEIDLATATLTTTLNGTRMQHAPLTDMIHSIEQIIEYCSTFTTLEPGDVIATGTPGGVGIARTPPVLMAPGDVVEVTIDGIGTLSTPVVDEAR